MVGRFRPGIQRIIATAPTTARAAAIAIIGGFAVLRWMPGRPRPTIEELVAAEVAAAERELEAGGLPARPELSER